MQLVIQRTEKSAVCAVLLPFSVFVTKMSSAI